MLERGDTLVIATHNPDKLREIGKLLAPYGLKMKSAGELGLDEPEETGSTFEANAELKAATAAIATGLPALADDSGLVVDALGGEPGVRSARWAGPDRDFVRAMREVEKRLVACGATTPEKRRARFVAVVCLAAPSGKVETLPRRGGRATGVAAARPRRLRLRSDVPAGRR